MAEEIELKLIFANDRNTASLMTSLNATVKTVKCTILQKHWPESPSLIPAHEVDRLRLFAAGKELGGKNQEDAKSLKEANILVSKAGPTPVHVMAVERGSNSAKTGGGEEAAKVAEAGCCRLL
eukprot:TRINITY_DN27715_c0_g1_i8.p3 TRINITY_DN27715_c0_g1~~TRINITY_DN27715_c0_g1_i8.p3  ORF type:complete len:123 (+),score=32.19 TRINITY_DN27715_c0_g1_i8:155-523(+)